MRYNSDGDWLDNGKRRLKLNCAKAKVECLVEEGFAGVLAYMCPV